MRSLDKFRGCLLAGAAGDALGYEVEFMPEDDIFRHFGEKGITEYCLHDGVAEIYKNGVPRYYCYTAQ